MSANPENNENEDPLAPESLKEGAPSETVSSEAQEGATPESDSSPEGQMDYPAVIETLRAELDQAKDQMMRALAEAENTRARAKKDREEASKFAISGFAKDLLSVSDNLRRGLDSVPNDLIESDVRIKNLLDGLEATDRELLKSFEKSGIKKLDPTGETFDPNFHEVMFEAPGTGNPAGTIIEVLETGYVLNGRLLRPARVGIAKDDGSAPADPTADPGSQIDTEA